MHDLKMVTSPERVCTLTTALSLIIYINYSKDILSPRSSKRNVL